MTLPPLPPPYSTSMHWPVYSESQMKHYATAAVKAALSKCGGDNCMGRRIDGNTNWVTEDALNSAVKAEREACAKVCDTLIRDWPIDTKDAYDAGRLTALRNVADEIRARTD